MNNNQFIPDTLKESQLKKHKALATGLFLLMMVVYAFCIWYRNQVSAEWIGYVKAFSEAAMVGALADWFAVTALFHHPLGIPIPHTNLIENRKKSIGNNLGDFVVKNFLNATAIRPYIERLQISYYVVKWLSQEKNLSLIVTEIAVLVKDVVEKIDEKSATKILASKSKELLNEIKLNEALAGGLNLIVERGDHERILNYVLKKVHDYVINNEELVRNKVREESHFLIPDFVDNFIAAKITKGAARYLDEIQNDTGHKIRKDYTEQIINFIADIKTNPKWQEELQDIKNGLLSGNRINEYALAVWKSIQAGVLRDLSDDNSAVKIYLKKTLIEMVQNLQNDETLRNKIDKWIRFNLYNYTLHNADKVGYLISNTVGTWGGRELSNKLELEVGKDLQFIRINGTLVGGLVGVLIYIITKFIEN